MGGGKDSDYLSLVAKKPDIEEAVNETYGVMRDQGEVPILRFIRPGGKPLTAPYSLMTFVWGDYLPRMILIEYSGFFTVRLTSDDDLTPLELLISKRRVTWIRACDPAAARGAGAVTAIDLLRYYPSRELSIDPAALKLEDA